MQSTRLLVCLALLAWCALVVPAAGQANGIAPGQPCNFSANTGCTDNSTAILGFCNTCANPDRYWCGIFSNICESTTPANCTVGEGQCPSYQVCSPKSGDVNNAKAGECLSYPKELLPSACTPVCKPDQLCLLGSCITLDNGNGTRPDGEVGGKCLPGNTCNAGANCVTLGTTSTCVPTGGLGTGGNNGNNGSNNGNNNGGIGSTCQADTNCNSGLKCISNVCTIGSVNTCSSNANCPSGQQCLAGFCIPNLGNGGGGNNNNNGAIMAQPMTLFYLIAAIAMAFLMKKY